MDDAALERLAKLRAWLEGPAGATPSSLDTTWPLTAGQVLGLVLEIDRLRDENERHNESLLMACENPADNCDCSGCSYAREKGGAS